jgi:hypothetical protein
MTREEFAKQPGIWYHGTVNGMIDPADTGFHVGTKFAAKLALGGHLQRRVDEEGRSVATGSPDLSATQGYRTAARRSPGFIAPIGHVDPHEPETGDWDNPEPYVYTSDPQVIPGRIVGPMANNTKTAKGDAEVNERAQEGWQQQTGMGEFYRNDAEHAGSVSAMLPFRSHFKTHEDYLVEARSKGRKIPKRAMEGYTEIPGQGRLF